jgi:multiple sugar transport system substrate-binding protein
MARLPSQLTGALASSKVLALLCLLCGGCAGTEGERSGVVRFWAFGREGEVVRALVPEFERQNPGLRVEVQQIPWTAAHEKLLTAYVGRSTPDVAQLGNTWIAELTALDALAPLDARIAATPALDPGDYFPGIWEANVVDGEVWGVPWYVDTRVLFYRKDLVAASGAPWPPRTWEEWREGLDLIQKAAGKDRYAILLPVNEWDKPVILGLQAGSGLLRDGGRHGAFREPPFRSAMAFYADLFAARLAPPVTDSGIANLYQQFAEGYFAMFVSGPWNLGELRRRLPPELQEMWGTVPLPAPRAADGYPGVSLAGGSSLVVFRGADDPDAAWRWVAYLSEPAQQARFYELSGDLPPRLSAWAATDLDRDPRAAAFRVQLAAVEPLPRVPECEQIANRVADAAEEVVRGARSLDEALAALDSDVDRMLEKRRYLLDRRAERGGGR